MDQKITIRIAGKPYLLKASSPENERMIRLAAQEVNHTIDNLNSALTGKNPQDVLAFVALNKCIALLTLQKQMAGLEEALKQLVAETGSYLSGAEDK